MFTNPLARTWTCEYNADPAVLAFHETLPAYDQTPLRALPQPFAQKHGVGKIFLKDESHRYGLPAYKILGASWACYRAVVRHLALPLPIPVSEVCRHTAHAQLKFYTATDGNWGRAVARMGSLLGAETHIYVPRVMIGSTRQKIVKEGGRVIVVEGDYDLAVKEAERCSNEQGGMLIEDIAWPGYDEIPQVSRSGAA